MKYKIVDINYSRLFINSSITDNVDFYNEKHLEKFLKEIILSLKEKYKVVLKGLYEVVLSINNDVGAVVELEKIENFLSSSKDIDLHIKVIFDCKFYFKTKDFYSVETLEEIYYYKGNYYVDASLIKDIFKYIEFGQILQKNEEDIEEIGMKVGKM